MGRSAVEVLSSWHPAAARSASAAVHFFFDLMCPDRITVVVEVEALKLGTTRVIGAAAMKSCPEGLWSAGLIFPRLPQAPPGRAGGPHVPLPPSFTDPQQYPQKGSTLFGPCRSGRPPQE